MTKKENILIIKDYTEYLNNLLCRSGEGAYTKKMRRYQLSNFFHDYCKQYGGNIANILVKLLGGNNRFYVSVASISSKLTDEEINEFTHFIKSNIFKTFPNGNKVPYQMRNVKMNEKGVPIPKKYVVLDYETGEPLIIYHSKYEIKKHGKFHVNSMDNYVDKKLILTDRQTGRKMIIKRGDY